MHKQKIAAIFLVLLFCLSAACKNPAGDSSSGNTDSGNTDNSNTDKDNTDNSNTDEGGKGTEAKTGKVTFFNESSYRAVVHQDVFSGPVLLELNSGQSKTADVRVSDNYGVGSTFSIEYLYRINDGFDQESGEVIAGGIDPNVQINFVVEEDSSRFLMPEASNMSCAIWVRCSSRRETAAFPWPQARPGCINWKASLPQARSWRTTSWFPPSPARSFPVLRR